MVKQCENNKNNDKNNTIPWKITKSKIAGGKKIDEPKEKPLLFNDRFLTFKESGLFWVIQVCERFVSILSHLPPKHKCTLSKERATD